MNNDDPKNDPAVTEPTSTNEATSSVDEKSPIDEPAIEEPGSEVPQTEPENPDNTPVEDPTAPEDKKADSTDDSQSPIEEPETPNPETEEVTDKAATDSEIEVEESQSGDESEEKAPGTGEDNIDETKGTEGEIVDEKAGASEDKAETTEETIDETDEQTTPAPEPTPGRWYVVHTFSGHENRVATTLKQRIDSEHLENKIFDILVPTQDKIEIRGGKKETVKEKIFPGYILIKMLLDDESWLAVRTTQGVTSFVGAANKPTPITDAEVNSIVKFTSQGAQPTFKEVFLIDDTVKIIDGPFSDFIGKVDSVDTEKGRVRVLVSIFGRETPVELDFLQVTKL
jgi:transcription termination/antitermination protein NusG